MNDRHEPATSTRDARKAYQPLKLVKHGHFLDVVKQFAPDGSQLVDTEFDTDAT